MSHAKHSHHDAHTGYAHVSSIPVLLSVFAALIVLTVLTVMATHVNLGSWNLVLALVVATIKAFLVALFFMHLLHDKGFNRVVFFGSFLFVALFVGLALLDTGAYQPTVDWDEKVLTK